MSFNQVSDSVRASNTFIELQGVRRSYASLFIPPHVGLIGQYDVSKTGIVDYAARKVTSRNEVGELYGFGSHIHRQALKIPDSVFLSGGGVTAFPLPEAGAGTAATTNITFTGTATSAGTLYFRIGGVDVQVAVASADTATVVGDSLVAAIAAKRDIAVTSSNLAGVVSVSAKGKGTYGNEIYIKQNPAGKTQEDNAPAGITVAGADVFLTTGATDPSVHDVFLNTDETDKLGDTWYTVFTCPYKDATNLGYYATSGDLRADAAVRRPFGTYPFYVSQTYSQALAIPATINKEWIGAAWDARAYAPAFELSAEIAGIIAREQNVAPSRPYKTLALSDSAIESANSTYAQKDALFRAGIGYCELATDGTLRLGDLPLTYRTDSSGGDTEAWFDAVSLHLRQAKIYSLEQIFKSAPYDRGVVVGNNDVTQVDFAIAPKDVIADSTKLIRDLWEPYGWTKNASDVIKSITAAINGANNSRIDAEVTDDEAKALRIVAILYKFLF